MAKMVRLFSPPPFVSVYAFCIDDELPKFSPDQWIEKNRLYRMKHCCESLNSDSMAVTLMDKNGNEIHPSSSMSSFRADRFVFFEIVLN